MKKKQTFKEFAFARLSVIQLEIAGTPDRPDCSVNLKLLRANEEYMQAGLAVYQDYLDEVDQVVIQ